MVARTLAPFSPIHQRIEITGPFVVENEKGVVTIESNVSITRDLEGLRTARAIKRTVDVVVHELERALSDKRS